MTRGWPILILVSIWSVGCGAGDNSAVRAFYSTVKPGASLPQLIAEAERAQAYDIQVSVSGRGCPGNELYVQRSSFEPSIRITQPPPNSARSWEQPYTENGYATREDFARGLSELVPRFYSCKGFVFTFGRYQGWPRSDSFTVTVDEQGRVSSVSPLKENDND